MTRTRWVEYGDPDGSDRVPVVVRTVYETGPGDQARADTVEFGTLPVEDLAALDEPPVSEHVHSDGSLLLSAVPDDVEARLLGGWEPDPARQQVWDLIGAGLSPTPAVDSLMTERTPVSQTEWARRRGASQPAVADAVQRAREVLD